MLARASPYGFGMYTALLYAKDSEHDYLKNKSSIIYEWLAFGTMICLSLIGCKAEWSNYILKNGPITFIWGCISRQIYGAAISYLTLLMLSPLPEETIAWYRPVRYMRSFLSMNIWLPFANLTYTFYLFHVAHVFLSVPPVAYSIVKGDREFPENQDSQSPCYFSPKETTATFLILCGISLVYTLINCVIVYVFLEK